MKNCRMGMRRRVAVLAAAALTAAGAAVPVWGADPLTTGAYAGAGDTATVGTEDTEQLALKGFYVAPGGTLDVLGKNITYGVVENPEADGYWNAGTIHVGEAGKTDTVEVKNFGGAASSETDFHGKEIRFGTDRGGGAWNEGKLYIGDAGSTTKVTVDNFGSNAYSETEIHGKKISLIHSSSGNSPSAYINGKVSVGDADSMIDGGNVNVVGPSQEDESQNSDTAGHLIAKGMSADFNFLNVTNHAQAEVNMQAADGDGGNIHIGTLEVKAGSRAAFSGNAVDIDNHIVVNDRYDKADQTDHELAIQAQRLTMAKGLTLSNADADLAGGQQVTLGQMSHYAATVTNANLSIGSQMADVSITGRLLLVDSQNEGDTAGIHGKTIHITHDSGDQGAYLIENQNLKALTIGNDGADVRIHGEILNSDGKYTSIEGSRIELSRYSDDSSVADDYALFLVGNQGTVNVGTDATERVDITGAIRSNMNGGQANLFIKGKEISIQDTSHQGTEIITNSGNGNVISVGDSETVSNAIQGRITNHGGKDIRIDGQHITLSGGLQNKDGGTAYEGQRITLLARNGLVTAGSAATDSLDITGMLLVQSGGSYPDDRLHNQNRDMPNDGMILQGRHIAVRADGEKDTILAGAADGNLRIGTEDTEEVRMTGGRLIGSGASQQYNPPYELDVQGRRIFISGNTTYIPEAGYNFYTATADGAAMNLGTDATDFLALEGGTVANGADVTLKGKNIAVTGNRYDGDIAVKTAAASGGNSKDVTLTIGDAQTEHVDIDGNLYVSSNGDPSVHHRQIRVQGKTVSFRNAKAENSGLLSLTGQAVQFDSATADNGGTIQIDEDASAGAVPALGRTGQVNVVNGNFQGTFKGEAAVFRGAVATNRAMTSRMGPTRASGDSSVSLSAGARWDVTGDSNVTRVSGDAGFFDTRYGAHKVTVDDTFSGSGSTFVMDLSDSNMEQRKESADSDYWYFAKKDDTTPASAKRNGLRLAVPVANGVAAPAASVNKLDINATKGTLRNMLPGDRVFFANVTAAQNGVSPVSFTPAAPAELRNARNLYNYNYLIGSDSGAAGSMDWYVGVAAEPKMPNENITTPRALMDSDYFLVTDMDRFYKRMGEAKYIDGDQGLWVRTRHTRLGEEDQFHYNGNRIQLGYDRKNGGRAYQGLAFAFDDGKVSLTGGESQTKQYALSLYDSWLGRYGHYADFVLTGGRLSDEVDVHTAGSERISADYHRWYMQASAEYGRKMERKDGMYVEPSVQLQYTHLTSGDAETNHGVKWDWDSLDSLIGRAGFRVGTMAEGKNFYLKADVLHEFAGSRSFNAAARDGLYYFSGGSHETWYDAGLGLDIRLDERTSFWCDFERVLGGHFDRSWNFNAGIRVKF